MVRRRNYRADETPVICACGCGGVVPKALYASQQARYINTHQHRGTHNGNYRGGKTTYACAVCGAAFQEWPSHPHVTCRRDECYREWQRLTSAARGQPKTVVTCDQCGAEIRLYPSQVKHP